MNTYYTTVVVPTINTTSTLLMFVNVQAVRLRASTAVGQVEEQHADGNNSNSGHHNDNDYC